MGDAQEVRREVVQAGLTQWHLSAALILLAVNGLECALQYVQGVRARKEVQCEEAVDDVDHGFAGGRGAAGA